MSTRKVLTPFFRRQWPALAIAGFSTILIAAAEVLRPFPLKFVIDHLFAGEGAPDSFDVGREELWLLAGVAGLVLGIAFWEAAANYVMDVRLLRAGERIVHDLRVAIYAHLQRLSLGFHQQRHTGDLVTRVTGDVNAVGTLFSASLATLISAVLTLVGMIVVSLILDPLLALVAFATAPLLAVISFRFKRRVRTLARRQRAMEGEIASLATEALASIQLVKALGSEAHEHERLERKSEERLQAGYEASIVEGRFARLIDIVGAVGTAAVLVVGVFRVEAGAITPGELVVMAAYARRVYRPLRTLAREWVRISRALARAERVAEVLSTDELLEDRGRTERAGAAAGTVEFDRVSFAYETGRPALRDVSLTIPAGQRVAVVGRSGAGKSTLAALAARFYDPDAGRVRIDGVDAPDYPLAWLRDQVGLVLQDTALFTGSVAENIAWGIDASPEDIVRAAQAAGADTFIRELPEGYDTELDPAGAGLSGGQRQRIAIARTLLRDPAILLLDEPTSGLDAESEAQVLAGLDVLMRGRTTVIITHALALARRAERAVVLDGGRLVQEGKPDELLREDGPFRRLAEEQGLVERRPRGRAPAFADPQLPHAGTLLDPDAAAEVLARSLGNGRIDAVDVRYLRYKPGTNLVVHYDVATSGGRHDAVGMIRSGTSLARRAAKPENLALARLVSTRAPAVVPLAYDEKVGCLVQWYPLDLSLPALATPPDELRRLLAGAGIDVEPSDEEPQRLAYKPRRRAVLRVDGHVVRLYARDAEFERALAGQRAASTLQSVVAPELEAALPERLVSVQSLLSGRRVTSVLDAASDAGSLLALLHASHVDGLSYFDPAAQLEAAAASVRLIGAIAPELRPRADRLLASLSASAPESVAFVLSHGDFHVGQLLDTGAAVAMVDFDEMCLAPPALDPATYAAHVVRGRAGDLDAALAALELLLEGYGRTPDGLSWYLSSSILRLGPFPFRYFDPGWRPRVGEMVAAAEAALAR